MSQRKELDKQYEPSLHEKRIYSRWLEAGIFSARPDEREENRRYVIMMPLPNVTGALHMGHAMDNVMQDLLIRWHRMQGDNALWMPGTDHAGIATQAVVEKRLFELEGKTRHDIGREGLVERIWEWKNEYQQRIIYQQQMMGCSCDWNRQRFTMDAVCTRAVREAFFRLFRDRLIFRGNRLVNWDCQLQTAVSDDEIVHETIQGYFWHIRYPVVDPRPGEPEFVVVATTRPETMLGDTAVACHPDPASALADTIDAIENRLPSAGQKEKPALEAELQQLRERSTHLLPRLERLRDMARANRKVCLPLVNREIPLILDEWARPDVGSGCVKITPAHDPNDYQVWQRHSQSIGMINILQPDGTLNENAGMYKGIDRLRARKKIVADLQALGLLQEVEEREIEVGHSDRSKTPIEPYLSKQWFVRMGDIEGNILCGAETGKEFSAAGLAQAAMDAVQDGYRSPSGRRLVFHPDSERYRSTYLQWLAEKRDWCISRQLWWGHRIPIWHGVLKEIQQPEIFDFLKNTDPNLVHAWISDEQGGCFSPGEEKAKEASGDLLVCLRNSDADSLYASRLEKMGLYRDKDVLDTWFSSALWPFSTLGWPDPESAPVDPGQSHMGNQGSYGSTLDYFYPGSCLVTARDIITLWVARMVLMGIYLLGDVPFTDCFIHANIQDGKGERMSKSKGNGIDPVDIIEKYGADAMRYVLNDMQTGTQDIRLPVQVVSPYTGDIIDLATAKHGRTIFTYLCPKTGKEFDVLGTIKDLPTAKIISERFETGRSFCTKLWNASRFALMSIPPKEIETFIPIDLSRLPVEDRWILSRLSLVCEQVTLHLQNYNPSAALAAAREFFWSEFCDWYLEIIKPRFKENRSAAEAASILTFCLDQVLRLFHPFVPFITETLWEYLGEIRPRRGLDRELSTPPLLASAPWPHIHPEWKSPHAEADFELMQGIVRIIRNWRSETGFSPSQKLNAVIVSNESTHERLRLLQPLIAHLANLGEVDIRTDYIRPNLSVKLVHSGMELFLLDVINPDEERRKLEIALKKMEQSLLNLDAKLGNSQFLQKAPAHIVEAEKQKMEKIRRDIELMRQSLRDLDKN